MKFQFDAFDYYLFTCFTLKSFYSCRAKRAAYRWARDRARIASRWSWLLAQISDLEYRIRQHHELYLLLKKNNGPVPFDGVSNANQTNQVAGASSSDPQILPPQSSVNGYRGVLPGSMRTSENQDSELKSSGDEAAEANGTARTRPFKPSAFKKRKLLQSTNLHKISKRAARPWYVDTVHTHSNDFNAPETHYLSFAVQLNAVAGGRCIRVCCAQDDKIQQLLGICLTCCQCKRALLYWTRAFIPFSVFLKVRLCDDVLGNASLLRIDKLVYW